ncbi:hypothetical protein [Nonomuraea sediminis]|uniref:hypothetical protein n=1 Tax=Nonomuraea sediminis TaxID=2835864 RepID=UPI001BDC78A1|nr:hypothetical protein [Nonomuraea sediminis]
MSTPTPPRPTRRQVLELHAELEARRKAAGLLRWQLAVQLDLTIRRLWQISQGVASEPTYRSAQAWLHRHTAPSPTTHDTKQGGNDDDSGDTSG